ncbi:SEC-C metal-binding domain-containing protein [Fredinandcohnia sp. QZ13]|uniref:SEC-C metal-binding domain-containing protein n=1 Tax=Fredinandcohnia sp. QZ13 TaxID=3073144 RepID=UPI0028536AE2|nr:SEC-C metal-binding domain-containing protein [Fredinandcohnia sp. QZ13]MDR4890114.1 SEC-C metal-binding domain-containing protein [Fredinandcohnia sp. QZ13]
MTFLEKIKPHLLSDDILIQQTVLHALHEYPNVPEEWTVELLKEAFRNETKQSDILMYIENQTINEEALNILIDNIPKMNEDKRRQALNLLNNIDISLAFTYKEQLEKYIPKQTREIFEAIENGSEEDVYSMYGKILNKLDQSSSRGYDFYQAAKKLSECIVKKGWVTEKEIDIVLSEENNDDWFSSNGIMNVYMAGLLNLEKHIPLFASFLTRDDDFLLEVVSAALVRFQSDQVVKEVAPYVREPESAIYAASILGNIKTDLALEELRKAYRETDELDEQEPIIEALSHHFSKEALPEFNAHMEYEYEYSLIDIEQVAYSFYTIVGVKHPDLWEWKSVAMGKEMQFQNTMKEPVPIRNENKVGRNDPCPCGSGKKYKKCCGK